MRPRPIVLLLTALARAAAASCQRRRRVAVTVLAGLLVSGCSPALTRPSATQPELLALRTTSDEQIVAAFRTILGRLLARTKAEYDQYTAGARPAPPTLDILIISGGGDWGAFGAGFLQGWQQVPAQHPLAKPEFDVVTGVSTGTLIAPFAFLGDAPAIAPARVGPAAPVPGRLPWGGPHGNSIARSCENLVRPHPSAVRPTKCYPQCSGPGGSPPRGSRA